VRTADCRGAQTGLGSLFKGPSPPRFFPLLFLFPHDHRLPEGQPGILGTSPWEVKIKTSATTRPLPSPCGGRSKHWDIFFFLIIIVVIIIIIIIFISFITFPLHYSDPRSSASLFSITVILLYLQHGSLRLQHPTDLHHFHQLSLPYH
jgi:hypothetical protein